MQNLIKQLSRSCVHPNISAYKTLQGPNDWNQYPMALPGTKAIIYKDSDTHASWAPHGFDAWLLRPSQDLYCCHLQYVPETSGYRLSGSANLFHQHCITPPYSSKPHICKLSVELQELLRTSGKKNQTLQVLRTLAQHLNLFVTGSPPPLPIIQLDKQRVIPLLWNFTSLGLSFSKYSAILAKSPPNKIPLKFHLLRKFPQNSFALDLDSTPNLPENLPCVWCTTEWDHTNTKRKSCLLVWMTQSHAMSNFHPFSARCLQDNVATSMLSASLFSQ
jgi:hypothetical protein